MAYNQYPYSGYQTQGYQIGSPGMPSGYFQAVPDQLAQLRQNQQMQNIQAISPAPESGGIIWVQGEAGAKAYLVAPGSTVQLWDSENPVIYLKSADMSGMPSMRVLDYTERGGTAGGISQEEQKIDLSAYITRDELEAILSERLKRPTKTTKLKEDLEDGKSTL